ncbi:MAG: DUF2726 domain-containing protein [Planctomycetes bacterium]|nr:DUF2726 domain-containing protein [Planctomycetota bacterium]
MEHAGIIGAVCVGVMVLFWILLRWRHGSGRLPYRRREALLTAAELDFLAALHEAMAHVGRGYIIAMQTTAAAVVQVTASPKERQAWQNRVNSKRLDFVLCDADTTRPRLVIELDDRSHKRPERRQRDALIDQIMQSAGLPILHVPNRRSYDARDLAAQIRQKLA